MAYVIPSGAAVGEIGKIRTLVAKHFPVYEMRVTPSSLVLVVHPDPATMAEKFDAMRQELWPLNYICAIRQETGETFVEVVRRPPRKAWHPWTNRVLLVATALTCLLAGAFLWAAYVGAAGITASSFLWGGLTFTLPVMLILGCHELAHYAVSRYRHVEASLPFFLPLPPPFFPFGTMGALISLREPIPDRRSLLEIGASGPIAGFVIAIPVMLLGLFLTAHDAVTLPLSNCGPVFVGIPYGDLLFGSSALTYGLSLFIPVSALVSTNPLYIAGWLGFLVTAINLLPAGQLDGGHVFRALFGAKSVYVSWIAVGALFVLGLEYEGWWLFGILILFLGIRHPPPLNDITPLDTKRKLIGAAAVGVLVIGFVMVPIATPAGDFSVSSNTIAPVGDYAAHTSADLNFSFRNTDIMPHAFTVNATVEVLNSSEAAARSYLANDSWSLLLPDGRDLMVPGSVNGGNFSMPGGAYITLNATGVPSSRGGFELELFDPAPASLSITVTISEDCRNAWQLQDGAPKSFSCSYPAAGTQACAS